MNTADKIRQIAEDELNLSKTPIQRAIDAIVETGITHRAQVLSAALQLQKDLIRIGHQLKPDDVRIRFIHGAEPQREEGWTEEAYKRKTSLDAAQAQLEEVLSKVLAGPVHVSLPQLDTEDEDDFNARLSAKRRENGKAYGDVYAKLEKLVGSLNAVWKEKPQVQTKPAE